MVSFDIPISNSIKELYQKNENQIKNKINNLLENISNDNYISGDNIGYIYCFINLDDNNNDTINYVKIGRSYNPHKRVDEWKRSVSRPDEILSIKTKCYIATERLIHLYFNSYKKDRIAKNGAIEREWFLFDFSIDEICGKILELVSYFNKIMSEVNNNSQITNNSEITDTEIIYDSKISTDSVKKDKSKKVKTHNNQNKTKYRDAKYRCIKCKYYTCDKSNFTRHTKTKSHIENTGIKINYVYICEHCNSKFSNDVHLNSHRETCDKNNDNINTKIDAMLDTKMDAMNNKIDALNNKINAIFDTTIFKN